MRSKMFLVPRIFSHWWEALERPHRLLDQHFAMALRPEQFFRNPMFDRRFPFGPPASFEGDRSWNEFMRNLDHGWSVVHDDKDKFHVALDVQQFKPEEVTVKVVDNCIVVEGKHEEKEDDHGVVSRHFVRKYTIPEQCDPEKTTSTLSTDGVLSIMTPLRPEAIKEKQERTVKIEHTGKPALEKETEEEPQKVGAKQ